MQIEKFVTGFGEEPGYLDYGRVGPLSRAAESEGEAFSRILSRARYGSLDVFSTQDDRVREAVSQLTGFEAENIVFQANTSSGLMHTMFGVTGGVLVSAEEFPSLPIAVVRAHDALRATTPVWLETDHGLVTPGCIAEQLSPSVAAVAVSLVDSRTGYVADLEGIRQVIGDRLLIVDAIQGFGVVDAPYAAADVVASGGQKWCRAGWGTGFLAISDRAVDQLTPVFSGFTGTDEQAPWGWVPPPSSSARAYRTSNPDAIAQARFAAALEEIHAVSVRAIGSRIAETVAGVLDLADSHGLAVVSPRAEAERAGILVLEPEEHQLTTLIAALHNHGVTTTSRARQVRLSVHAGTTPETLDMLRDALVSFSSAARY